jgi:DNA polymerase-3 subunit delta'
MNPEDLEYGDSIPGAPHPRETRQIFGQQQSETDFLSVLNSGRLHHGWLLTGPRGVGKSTLAWRIAQKLIADPPNSAAGLFGAPPPATTLAIDPDHPVSHRIQAMSEPALALVRRSHNEKTHKLRNEIVIDDIRALTKFFGLSATDGGHRVVIVDAADEMNSNAANGLLKMLEEPPDNCTLLLIAHQPSRLLPTIRSRCRTLRLSPLGPQDMAAALSQTGAELPENTDALTSLSSGSVGSALRLLNLDGLGLYAQIITLLGALPRLDRQRALALGDIAAARKQGDRFELLLTLFDIAVSRLALTGATGAPPALEAAPNEAEILMRLSPNPQAARAWADCGAQITARTRHGMAVNLDPASLVLDTVLKMQEAARA